ILWMEEGRVRAYGPAGEIAERYMNEINIEALANQSVNLQSHRGGTGESRYSNVEPVEDLGNPGTQNPPGDNPDVPRAHPPGAAGVPDRDHRRRHRPRFDYGDVELRQRAGARAG